MECRSRVCKPRGWRDKVTHRRTEDASSDSEKLQGNKSSQSGKSQQKEGDTRWRSAPTLKLNNATLKKKKKSK